MPSNSTWLCFDCRVATRRTRPVPRIPMCTVCGALCFHLGHKVEVPKKSDTRAWRVLRENCRDRAMAAIDKVAVLKVRRKHAAEKEIIRLSHMPQNQDRTRQIQKLRESLASYVTMHSPSQKLPNQSLQPTALLGRG